MKITVSYRTARQISPDEFQTYTKVIHLTPMTLVGDMYDVITKDWKHKDGTFDGEIHIEQAQRKAGE